MKTVFSNDELPHIWASRSQDNGRNSNDSFYFQGATIYSYGSHFPIAQFRDNGRFCLVTNQTYSNTTAKHIGQVWRAIPHYSTSIAVDNVLATTKDDHTKNARGMVAEIADCADKQTRARVYTYYSQINSRIADLRAYVVWSKINNRLTKLEKQLIALPEIGADNLADLLTIFGQISKQSKAQQKRAERQAKKRAEIQAKKQQLQAMEALEQWKQGAPITYQIRNRLQYAPIGLRISGDTVETTQGASIKLATAKRIWPELKARKLPTDRIDHFRADTIDDNQIVIGCHIIALAEIDRIGAELEAMA